MPTVISNGIRIHHEERGSGDPLILIMGLGWLRRLDYDRGRIARG
jgi:hypothetical protein